MLSGCSDMLSRWTPWLNRRSGLYDASSELLVRLGAADDAEVRNYADHRELLQRRHMLNCGLWGDCVLPGR